jgi:catechol 2,3-dioxygenase-like lactoylglutathione lyase family enzyme
MLQESRAFSGYSVRDLKTAKEFYKQTLGLKCEENGMGLILHLAGGTAIFLYEQPGHAPASFTVLNFPVEDIDAAVSSLKDAGIEMETFELGPAKQDEHGILRGKAASMGPDIAWFKDPSGNILSVLAN